MSGMSIEPDFSKSKGVPNSALDSVMSICKGANQVMVYGWSHCNYVFAAEVISMATTISFLNFPIKKVHNHLIGDPDSRDRRTTHEGRKLNLIAYDKSDYTHGIGRMCKTAITNLVLENYKRAKEGLPLIPVLFCIDIVNNPKPWSIQNICSKAPENNKQITHKELRRAFKLCHLENEEIRRIARETFKFVKVGEKGLEAIDAPWASPDFARYFSIRKTLSNSKPKTDSYNWSKQLIAQIAVYDASKISPDRIDEKEKSRANG